MPVLPLSSFVAHDKRIVLVETMNGEQCLAEPDEVAVYVTVFDMLHAAGRGRHRPGRGGTDPARRRRAASAESPRTKRHSAVPPDANRR